MNDKIIKLLSDLAAFNRLDEQVLGIISDVFKVDAEKLAKENGITWVVK